MPNKGPDRDLQLKPLDETVGQAVAFLGGLDDSLFDGHQSAREVLSHLVYWHREYVSIAQALVDGREPPLKRGTFAELNAEATCEFESLPMLELALRLGALQTEFGNLLRQIPDWGVNFPVKFGGRNKNIADRISAIEAHIRNHIKRMRRAERLGQAWIKAYFSNTD